MRKFAVVLIISFISCQDNSQKSDSAMTIEEDNDNFPDSFFKPEEKPEEGEEEFKKEDIALRPIECNIDVIVQLKNNMNSPSDTVILRFYRTFDKECENNVEYLEFSNKVLHELFYHHPIKSLILLSDKKVDFGLIIKELNNPVTDRYELKDIYQKVKETPDSLGQIREIVLQNIEFK